MITPALLHGIPNVYLQQSHVSQKLSWICGHHDGRNRNPSFDKVLNIL